MYFYYITRHTQIKIATCFVGLLVHGVKHKSSRMLHGFSLRSFVLSQYLISTTITNYKVETTSKLQFRSNKNVSIFKHLKCFLNNFTQNILLVAQKITNK